VDAVDLDVERVDGRCALPHVLGDPVDDAQKDPELDDSFREWLARDDALRARARVLAEKLRRDEEGIYRTLKNLARAPAERLRLGLRHGRLHPDHR
jgi:hypothetical protein